MTARSRAGHVEGQTMESVGRPTERRRPIVNDYERNSKTFNGVLRRFSLFPRIRPSKANSSSHRCSPKSQRRASAARPTAPSCTGVLDPVDVLEHHAWVVHRLLVGTAAQRSIHSSSTSLEYPFVAGRGCL